ncbi:MAG: hypothetical protein NW701_15020 [Nitrospira sp.]
MQLRRISALIFVGLLSVFVLGGVWAAVIFLLPHDADESIGLAQTVPSRPTRPDPAPSIAIMPSTAEESSVAALPPPDPLPAPSHTDPVFQVEAAVPLNIEIRCEAEIESACPAGSLEERRQCMQSRLRQLSVPCRRRAREHLVRMKVNLQHIRRDCEVDVRRFCSDVESGKRSIVQCLEARAQEVSDPCFRTLPKRGRLMP